VKQGGSFCVCDEDRDEDGDDGGDKYADIVGYIGKDGASPVNVDPS
jgi:hypothetical protein